MADSIRFGIIKLEPDLEISDETRLNKIGFVGC